jgi:large subunit ribosomal protein L9
MKVVIKKTGEVKKVSLGHAVNFLLPKGLAEVATEKKIAELKQKQAAKQEAKREDRLKNRQQAERLDGKVIEFKVKAGKAGKIHGSVSKKQVAKLLEVLKENVILDKPIKKIGEYEVGLRFGRAQAKVKIKVKADDESKKTKKTS